MLFNCAQAMLLDKSEILKGILYYKTTATSLVKSGERQITVYFGP